MTAAVTVVGIGMGAADLSQQACEALGSADVVIGAPRQVAVVRGVLNASCRHLELPSPLRPGLLAYLAEYPDRNIVVLASGDPMWHGIGATMVELLGAERVRIIPGISTVAAVCARMAWSIQDVAVVSLVTAEISTVAIQLTSSDRVVVLCRDASSPRQVAQALVAAGQAPARCALWSQLTTGGPLTTETARWQGSADQLLAHPADQAACWATPVTMTIDQRQAQRPLQTRPQILPQAHAVVEGSADSVASDSPFGTPASDQAAADGAIATAPGRRLAAEEHGVAAGLPDDCFEHDGQLTKRAVRAVTLGFLRPSNGLQLWDIGTGSGSISVEWLRLAPHSSVVAVDRNPERAARAQCNLEALAPGAAEVRVGDGLAAFSQAERADVIFVGGGLSSAEFLAELLHRLRPAGRLVANAVTCESRELLQQAHRSYGGDLTDVAISNTAAVGKYSVMRPQLPVMIWHFAKEANK